MDDEEKIFSKFARLPEEYKKALIDKVRLSQSSAGENREQYKGGSIEKLLAGLFKGMETDVRLPTGRVGTATPEVKRTRTGLGATLGVNVTYAKGGAVQSRGNGKSLRMKSTKIR